LQSVTENEKKYEVLKSENEEKRANLQKILLQNDNKNVISEAAKKDKKDEEHLA
jgi:hypothetical protein